MSSLTGSFAGDASSGYRKVLLGRYELGSLLGRGASAKVFLARDLLTGASVAVKSFPNPRCDDSPAPAIKREVALMRRLRHPHVLRLHEVLATRSKVHFVLELAGGGELFSALESRGRLPEDLSRRYFQQLISAVHYCHSRGVFHRDIKPENLLLDDNGDLKVADFGLGAQADQIRHDGLFHTSCGTPAYVAPEILSKKGYDAGKVDVWSCGVVLFVLAAGYLPFNDPNLITMYKKIYRGEFRCPKWFSPELRNLVCRILDPNPKTRMAVGEILDHPWFRKDLDEEKWTAAMRSHDEEVFSKLGSEEQAGRVLNAFDIISFSSGCDLSGLLGVGPSRERFFVTEQAESVASRVEEVGKREGFRVRRGRNKGSGPVVVEGRNGKVVARVEAFRVSERVSVVEAVRGDGSEAIRFWKERLETALKSPTVHRSG